MVFAARWRPSVIAMCHISCVKRQANSSGVLWSEPLNGGVLWVIHGGPSTDADDQGAGGGFDDVVVMVSSSSILSTRSTWTPPARPGTRRAPLALHPRLR